MKRASLPIALLLSACSSTPGQVVPGQAASQAIAPVAAPAKPAAPSPQWITSDVLQIVSDNAAGDYLLIAANSADGQVNEAQRSEARRKASHFCEVRHMSMVPLPLETNRSPNVAALVFKCGAWRPAN